MNEGWVFIVGADWVGIVDQRDGFRIGKMEASLGMALGRLGKSAGL